VKRWKLGSWEAWRQWNSESGKLKQSALRIEQSVRNKVKDRGWKGIITKFDYDCVI